MPWQPILGGLLIFALRVLSVSMGTVRTLLIVRGSRIISAVIGFFEVLIFVVAISQVIADLSNIWNLLGYCGGFAAGVLVGMALEERLAVGLSMVRIISKTHWLEITQALRQEGFGATQVFGEGKEGTVGIIYSMVPRKQVPAVIKLCDKMDCHAFITVEEAGRVHRGYMPRPAR
jgi:uncharacterized protein YebE (UPF0316 family)